MSAKHQSFLGSIISKSKGHVLLTINFVKFIRAMTLLVDDIVPWLLEQSGVIICWPDQVLLLQDFMKSCLIVTDGDYAFKQDQAPSRQQCSLNAFEKFCAFLSMKVAKAPYADNALILIGLSFPIKAPCIFAVDGIWVGVKFIDGLDHAHVAL